MAEEGLQGDSPQSVWETLEKRCKVQKDKANEGPCLTLLGYQDSLPVGSGLAGVIKGNCNSHSALQGTLAVWIKVSIE